MLLLTQLRYCFPSTGGQFAAFRSRIATTSTSGGKAEDSYMRGVQLAMLAPTTTGFSLTLSTPMVKQNSPIESAIRRTNDSLAHEPNTQGGEKSLKIRLPCAPDSCISAACLGGYFRPERLRGWKDSGACPLWQSRRQMMTFEQLFKAATSHAPFRWQARLYGQLLKGKLPPRCNIPTGLGKTSIIHIWLLALAEQLRTGHAGITLPRRLVYIVDRRVVVDQATEEAEELLARFKSAASAGPSDPLGNLARCLAETGSLKDNDPFTVSTLRGQHADNRLWLRDPARPAIIIGTVDMIGSRLLFSGYGGLGRYSRSLHAALLAQDALIVLDEAHLCPSFVETLDALARQLNRRRSIKPLHVMLLSATQLPPGEATPTVGQCQRQ